uniref:Coat protein n=1 Tax=Erysiphales associated totivirus 17 TaxID=2719846 RepID=A0A6G9ELQ9_9VIRU|nr:coat protein [Erysiphales associated totivirus 17]
MEFIKDIIDVQGVVDELTDGQLMVKAKATLGMSGCTKTADDKFVGDRERPVAKEVGVNLSVDQLVEFRDLTSERVCLRNTTTLTSTYTVYGPACRWTMSGKQHSTFGLSPAYLHENGAIKEDKLLEDLFKMSPDVEINRYRLNRRFNTYLDGEWYENATALFVALYKRLWLTRFVEKVTTNEYEVDFYPGDIANCKSLDSFFSVVRAKLESMSHEVGFSLMDSDIQKWATVLYTKSGSLPAATLKSKDGKEVRNPKYSEVFHTFRARYWTKYSYDDGHSKSGKKFLSEAGFGEKGFKVPADLTYCQNDGEYLFKHAMPWDGMDDKAIDRLGRVKYHLNCDGLDGRLVALLNNIMSQGERMTPFLCDQDFNLGIGEGTVAIYNVRKEPLAGSFNYSSRDVQMIISRMINNHRYYEEARSAYLLFNNWLAQPSTETMESHWWVLLSRTMNVPKLGLMRAAFPVLLSVTGVKITNQAMTCANAMLADNDVHLFQSGACNALWFWGEYLAIHNGKNVATVIKQMSHMSETALDTGARSVAMMSAVLGKTVPTPVFSSAYTTLSAPLMEQGRRVVHFGHIDSVQNKKYGYTTTDKTTVIANTIVAPGAVATVLGLNGSLIQGTPISGNFIVRGAQFSVDMRGKRKKYLSYLDLWCSGVVARWQGYDLQYSDYNSASSMVMYASNDTGIAVPPVLQPEDDMTGLYKVGRVEERNHVFGTDFVSYWNLDKHFFWSVTHHKALSSPSRKSSEIEGGNDGFVIARHALVHVESRPDYMTALVATYDPHVSGFQVARTAVAIPLLDDTEPYAPVDQEEPQIADQMGAGEATTE